MATGAIVRAVVIGVLVLLAGTLPRNALFQINLQHLPSIPWSAPLAALYLWVFWRYVRGYGPPQSTADERRTSARANRLPPRVWAWSLIAGGLGLGALIAALRVANRLIVLPPQEVADLSHVADITVLVMILVGALLAGVVEETAFRGYMQGPIERHAGLPLAILISGTMFALVHLDFTPILWPYYVGVAAVYGTVTYLANSTLPAVVLHTIGNIYSNVMLWRFGRAEWQASSGPAALIWEAGADASFWASLGALLVFTTAAIWSYARLARVVRTSKVDLKAAPEGSEITD